jgi:hypothetical protein
MVSYVDLVLMRSDEHFQGRSKGASEPSGHLGLDALKILPLFSVRFITTPSVSRPVIHKWCSAEPQWHCILQLRSNKNKTQKKIKCDARFGN